MKQNLLKTCLVMLFAVLGFGMSWAVEVPATLAAGTNGSAAQVNEKTAIKVGTGKLGGDMTITVPANAVSLTFYAAAWNGVTDLSLNITPAASVATTSIALTADAGVSGNSPFTLTGEEDDYKYTIDLKDINAETTLTLTSSAAKRFVVWAATCEVQSTATYTVTFDAGANGTCSTTALTEASAGAGVTLPAVTANEGFAFQGWSTSETPSSADAGVAGETYNPLADVTLYAYYTVARPANEVFYESFDKNAGTGGNDGQWSGSIASNNIQYDNEGWVVANASGASHCAKFGAGAKLGSATTPAIAASGYFTLSFKAGAWNGNNESTTLKLSATGATLSAETVTLTKGAWDTYSVNILNATEGFTVTFEGNAASNSRFFLDEVSVVTADAPVATYTKQTLEFVASQPEAYGDVYYATFSSSKDAFIPDLDYDGDEYLTQVFTVNVEGGKLNVDEVDYDWDNYITIGGRGYAGYYIPANTGVLVSGIFETVSHRIIYFDVENVEIPVITNTNLLRPASVAMEGDYNFYKLAYDNYEAGTGLGFYWGAANGAAFEAKVGGAYLAVPKSASSAKGFRFDGGDVTGIKAAAIEKSGNIYNLQGQRVSRIQQGVNIVNGKKVVR